MGTGMAHDVERLGIAFREEPKSDLALLGQESIGPYYLAIDYGRQGRLGKAGADIRRYIDRAHSAREILRRSIGEIDFHHLLWPRVKAASFLGTDADTKDAELERPPGPRRDISRTLYGQTCGVIKSGQPAEWGGSALNAGSVAWQTGRITRRWADNCMRPRLRQGRSSLTINRRPSSRPSHHRGCRRSSSGS